MDREMQAELRAVWLSNVTFEPYIQPLMKQYFGEKTAVCSVLFSGYLEDAARERLREADLIVVWLHLETLSPGLVYGGAGPAEERRVVLDGLISLCRKLYRELVEICRGKIVWFSFEEYAPGFTAAAGRVYTGTADALNLALYEELGGAGGPVSFMDLKGLTAQVGIPAAYDAKGKYRWNAPYSRALTEAAVKELLKQYRIEKGITRKCLVLDCDNVLWGGLLAEDGIENLRLGAGGRGRLYQDFQRFVLALYRRGVLLAVCSKNDEADVLEVFRGHSEMLLREEQIACFQVNWGNKPDNIRKIAETLRIGLDSIVFVDDSPAEVEAARAMLPETTAVLFSRDMDYEEFACFNLRTDVSGESAAQAEKRTETYRTDRQRAALQAAYADHEDYLRALGSRMDIHEAEPMEYSRLSELTQRTNRCTNGRRYTVSQLQERAASPKVRLYSVFLSDRFSDLGLVGAMEVEDGVLTLFSLSCRALGREIESGMLGFIMDRYTVTGFLWSSTGKNKGLRELLAEKLPGASCVEA